MWLNLQMSMSYLQYLKSNWKIQLMFCMWQWKNQEIKGFIIERNIFQWKTFSPKKNLKISKTNSQSLPMKGRQLLWSILWRSLNRWTSRRKVTIFTTYYLRFLPFLNRWRNWRLPEANRWKCGLLSHCIRTVCQTYCHPLRRTEQRGHPRRLCCWRRRTGIRGIFGWGGWVSRWWRRRRVPWRWIWWKWWANREFWLHVTSCIIIV